MNPARFTVKRPVLTLMVTLIVIIIGAIAFQRLPVDLMPDISYPTLSISTSYENTSPEVIEQLITRPLEEAMSAVPGIEEISSVSSEGGSRVTLSFAWGTDLNDAVDEVRERLDRVTGSLPDDADRPRLFKFDPANFPIIILGLGGDIDPVSLRRMADEQISHRLERIPGVAAVDVHGGRAREVHVDLLPDRLRALDIPMEQVVAAVKAGNLEVPAGQIESGLYEVGIRIPGEYRNIDELANTAVAVRRGSAVRLSQIALVGDSWRQVRSIARINGKPGIRIGISKQSGKNTVEVAKGIRKELVRLRDDFPQLDFTVLRDSSEYIQRSINNVGSAAVIGGILTVIVLLFFLRSLGATAVIATSIPISIVATFALMYFSGYTLNIMSLGGLALGVGMLVDNSIVVIENIFRLRASGLEPAEAAVEGTGEVTSAIVASTLTTVAVFIPFAFVRGMAGVTFKQLAVVVSFSLACSLVTALTLVPMFASRLLRGRAPGLGRDAKGMHAGGNPVAGGNPRGRFDFAHTRLGESYKALLRTVLKHPRPVIVGALILLAMSCALIPFVGSELMPAADEGEVRISGEMDAGTKLEKTDQAMRALEPVVSAAVPEAVSSITSVGGSGFGGSSSNSGSIQVRLKPRGRRSRSDVEVASDLQRKVEGIPGLKTRVRTGSGFFLLRLASGGTEQVQVEIRGFDVETASRLADQVQALVEDVPGVTDARLSRATGVPELHLNIDRARASDLNLTVSQISGTLKTALAGTRAGALREGGGEYDILVKLRGAERLGIDEILDLSVRNAEGVPVVMRNVVRADPRSGPVSIERKNQERVMYVNAQVRGRDLGSVVRDIRERVKTLPVPEGFGILFGGDVAEQRRSSRESFMNIFLSLVLVFMIMASLYESFRFPFVVMFSVPFAVIGVVLILFFTGTTFNMQSRVGILMLGGIVVNNAIILVDHINLLRTRDGMPLVEAIVEAGGRRLRPILMTTITTVFGLIPLAFGLGEGGEAQAPLARAVVGGLASSTLITLVLIPTIYFLFERHREGRTKGGETR